MHWECSPMPGPRLPMVTGSSSPLTLLKKPWGRPPGKLISTTSTVMKPCLLRMAIPTTALVLTPCSLWIWKQVNAARPSYEIPPILPGWWTGWRTWHLPCLWPTLKMFPLQISTFMPLPRWLKTPINRWCSSPTVAGTWPKSTRLPAGWRRVRQTSSRGRLC